MTTTTEIREAPQLERRDVLILLTDMCLSMVDDPLTFEVTRTTSTVIIDIIPTTRDDLKKLVGHHGSVINAIQQYAKYIGSRHKVKIHLSVLEVEE